MDEIRFCGTIEHVRGSGSRWGKPLLLYAIRGQLPGISDADVRAAYAQAFTFWQEVCGLTFSPGTFERADIRASTGRIDGPMGVLAWSELPPGDNRPLAQMYDNSERFTLSETPGRGQIDLVAVATHEIGHALGLDHSREGTGDLMEPTYQPGRRKPQRGDIQRIQQLYGPPVLDPTKGGGSGDEPAEMVIIGQSGKVTARFKLTRIG